MASLWSDIRNKLFSEVLGVLLVDYVMVTDELRRQEWRNDIIIKYILKAISRVSRSVMRISNRTQYEMSEYYVDERSGQISKVNINLYRQCNSERTQRKFFVHQAKRVEWIEVILTKESTPGYLQQTARS